MKIGGYAIDSMFDSYEEPEQRVKAPAPFFSWPGPPGETAPAVEPCRSDSEIETSHDEVVRYDGSDALRPLAMRGKRH